MIKTKFHSIGKDNLYFIADIGANHDGSLNKAIELIHLCKESGANAAKFQNFSANKIVSKFEFDNMPRKTHQATWEKSVYEVYQDASISEDWTKILSEECRRLGIDYFTSPYDKNAIDHVDEYVDIYKIGSGDISWLEIIEYIIDKEKPLLFATGASNMDDVDRVMSLINKKNAYHVLMQCNTNYTGSNENFKYINLKVLESFKEKYPNSLLGLSDHTPGHSTVLGSIALGATVIEKHFTDNNNNIGPDHFFAMNPSSWREMVDRSMELFDSLGDGVKRVEENEKDSFFVQRRSIVAKHKLKKGHTLGINDLDFLRPYTPNSFHPYEKELLIGKILNKNFSEGQSFKKEDLV
jgi:sialic acid synthase SpsE